MSSQPAQPSQRVPTDVRRLFALAAVQGFTVDGVVPVIFNLYLLRMGYGPDFVGLVNSVALILFSAASLPAGAAGSRFGVRTVMRIGIGASVLSTFALGITDLLPVAMRSAWLLVMLSVLYAGVAVYFSNSAATVVNLSPISQRARVVSVQSAIGNFFAFLGSISAGFVPILLAILPGWSLADAGTYRIPLLICGGVYGLAFLLVLTFSPAVDEAQHTAHVEPSGERGAPPVVFGFAGTLIMISLIRMLQATGTGSGNTFFNVYMDDGLGVTPQYIGIMVALSRLLAVFAALIVPTLLKRLGTANGAVVGSLVVSLSIVPLALVPIWQVAGVSYMILNAASAFRYNAYFVYMMSVTPPRLRTIMGGAGELSGGLGFALTSFAGGLMIVRFGYAAFFLFAASLTLAGTILNFFYTRWRSRTEAEALARHEAPTRPLPLAEGEPAD